MRKLTLEKATTLEFTPPFELLNVKNSQPFQLPQGGLLFDFADWMHLVEIVAVHDWKNGPLWLIPIYSANPFLDFAFVVRDEVDDSYFSNNGFGYPLLQCTSNAADL
mmetsp:Transcript_23978/g.32849  ORF Transcript_23978/g.32849 Transcript_23978/m.32849 type:complete len:107 (-) Transcript_23978:379-699(-)